jgi:DNA invertase Pin-like site-specific DNA recombinase
MAFLYMLGMFADLEANLRKERQAKGIAAEMACGVYKGRKAKIDDAAVHNLGYGKSSALPKLRDGSALAVSITCLGGKAA